MGLMVICADEMHQASSEISGWLRQRKEEIAWTGERN